MHLAYAHERIRTFNKKLIRISKAQFKELKNRFHFSEYDHFENFKTETRANRNAQKLSV